MKSILSSLHKLEIRTVSKDQIRVFEIPDSLTNVANICYCQSCHVTLSFMKYFVIINSSLPVSQNQFIKSEPSHSFTFIS